MKKIILLELITILILSACEKVVTVDIPEKDSRLVLAAWWNKDKAIELKVSKSLYILNAPAAWSQGQESYIVKNAVPVVYENNISIDTLVYDAQKYSYTTRKNSKVRDGYSYSVKVSAAGFKEVRAETIVPVQSVIAGLTRQRKVRTNSAGEQLDDVIIKLNDPVEKNFYLIKFFSSSFGSMNGNGYVIDCVTTTDKDIEPIGDDDPLDSDKCFDGNNLLMKDVNFNGRQKQVKISVASFLLDERKNPDNTISRPYIKLYQITEDYFNYLKSYAVYNKADDNPFAEPVNVYSNVANGYGIFSAHTVAVDTIR